jgi:hypothetical protein
MNAQSTAASTINISQLPRETIREIINMGLSIAASKAVIGYGGGIRPRITIAVNEQCNVIDVHVVWPEGYDENAPKTPDLFAGMLGEEGQSLAHRYFHAALGVSVTTYPRSIDPQRIWLTHRSTEYELSYNGIDYESLHYTDRLPGEHVIIDNLFGDWGIVSVCYDPDDRP